MAMLTVADLPAVLLVFTGISVVAPKFVCRVSQTTGPHGLSEIFLCLRGGGREYGSAFAGLSANTLWYNSTIGATMLLAGFSW